MLTLYNPTFGLVNYKNGTMRDVIGLVSTTSSSPIYTADRFGNAIDAILVNRSAAAWFLPKGVYLTNDFTVTAWFNNISCNGASYISKGEVAFFFVCF
jgi:hypothetical protein